MDFALSSEQESMRREIIRFAQRELNEGVVERDREQIFRRELWTKCGEMGLLGLPVPQEYGGGGLDPVTTAIALEALGYGCHDAGLVFSLCAHLLACVVPLWKHGSRQQKERYLPGLCGGRLIAANAITEPEAGSDAFSMAARARPDGSGFRITGTKTLCTNAPVADLALVFAATDPAKGYHGGITAFLVERDTPGLLAGRRLDKMGLRTSPTGELVLDDVYVPAEAVLGRIGAGANVFGCAMDWERVCLFANHVGVMERLLEKSIQQARCRKQFGQSIGKFQAVSHRIAEAKVRLEAARLLTYRAAWELERSRAASLSASIAKLYVSESFVDTARMAMQILGGYGFTTEYEVERALRDALGSTLYSGTSEMQKNIIARWLGV